MNTAEHFALVLSPKLSEELLIGAALPYLVAGGNNNLIEIFEAAHSVTLAVLAAPQSANLTAKHLPLYVDALFRVFPKNLSPRQFRLAFKTVVRITASPSSVAGSQPLIQSTLLEIVHDRSIHASVMPIGPMPSLQPGLEGQSSAPSLSEKAVLTMTILDSLPFLDIDVLEEWLPITANLVGKIEDDTMRDVCQRRLWEVLSGGEMDVERSALCVTWWNSRGGREAVLYGHQSTDAKDPYMSGALDEQSKL